LLIYTIQEVAIVKLISIVGQVLNIIFEIGLIVEQEVSFRADFYSFVVSVIRAG
jgi:hypothetical protein